MDISWPVSGSWALAACSSIALAAYFLVRWARRMDARRSEYRERVREEGEARKKYMEATRHGTPEEAVAAAKELDEKRKALDAIRKALRLLPLALAAAFLASASQGCVTRTKEVERIVTLDAHIRIVQPGDTIPDYPDGETRWWLLSPTGLMELVPTYRQEEF